VSLSQSIDCVWGPVSSTIPARLRGNGIGHPELSALQEQQEIFYGTKGEHTAHHKAPDIIRAIKHGMFATKPWGMPRVVHRPVSTPYAVCRCRDKCPKPP